jgi:site-specific recombinase XerD
LLRAHGKRPRSSRRTAKKPCDPFSNRGFQATVERAGKAAGFGMKIHPHMLRHACGYKLANDGVDTRTIQAYLGHKSIQHTVRYTELAPTRFKSLFRD